MMKMIRPLRSTRSEQGFSLLELLVVVGLMAMILALSVGPLRNYWLTQSLIGSRDEIVSELRRSQERAVSESNPFVWGVLLREGSSEWTVVQYNPDPPAGTNECIAVQTNTLETGTQVGTATFASVPEVTTACDNQIENSNADDFVFFFPRGSASNGQATVVHPSLPGRSWTITVTPITGRVVVD